MKKQKEKEKFKKCVFCNNNFDKNTIQTREHIFGLKTCKILKIENQNIRDEQDEFKSKEFIGLKHKKDKALIAEFQHYGICNNCNNKWMNEKIEQPIHNLLKRTKNLHISFFDLQEQDQEVLAKYFTKVGILLLSYKNTLDPHSSFGKKIFKNFKETIEKDKPIESFLKNTGSFLFIDRGNNHKNNQTFFFDCSNTFPKIKDKNNNEIPGSFQLFTSPKRIVVKIGKIIFCLALFGHEPQEILWTDFHFTYPKTHYPLTKNYKFVEEIDKYLIFLMGKIHQNNICEYMVYFGSLIFLFSEQKFKDDKMEYLLPKHKLSFLKKIVSKIQKLLP